MREFYYRRAKRLLPAAYVVTLVTVVLAPLFLSAVAVAEMKARVLGAVTFTANLVLMRQSGYFDGAAETKPFLHFWSLALEEQYYLVVPVLLLVLGRRVRLAAVTAASVLSLALAVGLASTAPDLAFYVLPTRAWELGAGSIVALVPIERLPAFVRRVAWLTAAVVILLVPTFPSGGPHPGLDALLVVLATALAVAGRTGPAIEASTVARSLAGVGDISYSLYLTHWPAIVFTRAAWSDQPPAWALWTAVLVATIGSVLLYRFVEEPFRRGFLHQRRLLAGGLAVAAVVLALLPGVTARAWADDRDYTHVRRINYGLDRACVFNERVPFTGELPEACRTREDAKVLIWGDSYAMAWASALKAPLADVGLEQATRGACDPLLGMARFPPTPIGIYDRDYARGCIDIHRRILEYASRRDQLEIVILAGRFATILSPNNLMLIETPDGETERPTSIDLAAEGLAALARALREAGKRVVLLAPPPADGSDIGDCLERRSGRRISFGPDRSCDLKRVEVDRVLEERRRMLALASEWSGVPVVDMTDFFCDDARCRTMIDGTFLYRDSGHLAYEGAELIGERSDLAERIMSMAR